MARVHREGRWTSYIKMWSTAAETFSEKHRDGYRNIEEGEKQ